ncbi:MAG: molybdopterin-dependent oxidoreductase [Cyanobacteria bacterium P01_A01_bin.84]
MHLHLYLQKILLLMLWGLSITSIGGCEKKISKQQIEALRREAIARNSQILAANTGSKQPQPWKLLIQGQINRGKSIELNWKKLLDLATDTVKTTDANNVLEPDKVFEFKGIRVSRLLKQFDIPPDAKEITFVCFDSYQVTLKVEDLFTYPITLAIAKNGQKIKREQGGPIYLVFPYTEYPELRKKYKQVYWAFYVTHMIVDTETPKLQVGNTKIELADLDKLPQQTILEEVGYRSGWDSDRVKVHGVWMRDIFALVPKQLPTEGSIKIFAKPPIYRDSEQPIRLNVKDIRECDIMLATRWGEKSQPIIASKGGPITLAFKNSCNNGKNRLSQRLPWLTFVEELSE